MIILIQLQQDTITRLLYNSNISYATQLLKKENNTLCVLDREVEENYHPGAKEWDNRALALALIKTRFNLPQSAYI